MPNEFQRKQFTFYGSFLDGVEELPEEEQGPFLLALVRYALRGTEPKLENPMTRMAFKLIRPNLDSSRKKSQANSKESTGIPQGNLEVTSRKPLSKQEDSPSPTPLIEKEREIKKENKIENEYSAATQTAGKLYKSEPQYKPNWFNRFYDLYPKKVARAIAVVEWDKLRPDRNLCEVMSKALEQHKRSEQWKDTKMIPNIDKWLREQRWTDELEEAQETEEDDYWANEMKIYRKQEELRATAKQRYEEEMERMRKLEQQEGMTSDGL